MNSHLDDAAVSAAFAQPDSSGLFAGAYGAYLKQLGAQRPAIIFAFPPKAAGTFLRTAAIAATGGQLIRSVHAQGGRDAQFYLPIFISYFLGGLSEKPLVTHVHMQALPANRHFIDALDLRPVVMLRSIPDMLASYWDMLESDETARIDGLNCPIPQDFPNLSRERKGEFLVDFLAPWYAGYFATWLNYAAENPGKVCILRYRELLDAPEAVLEKALQHARIPRSRERCGLAIRSTWDERHDLRFNKGEEGRGKSYLSWRQLARIPRLLSYHAIPDNMLDELAE